ncbi:MAG: MarR family transcriptional regulator [Ignavibacteria bacterium]|jgi:DNA-binding MarR family transcriptional regulator|nr:MarR family transcriptional regulator [Ignavibacteria bacterium]MCU7504624.1 MarR family transcriptional regulator [Ignavibacteria bacterium]MCU7517960.1 MarR family transcriptional regulator [Ignavibacteria bacterium]
MKTDNEKAEKLAGLILNLTRNCNIREEHFAASFNLSPAEVKLLKLFAFNSTLSIKEICSLLSLTPGRITHIVTSLEEKKLLTRNIDQKDKRNVIVSTAPKCAPFINNLVMSYLDLYKRVLKSVSEEDRENMFHSLEILGGIFSKWVEENKV